MSGRCRSCNAILTSDDLVRKIPTDEKGVYQYSDLCSDCNEVSLAVLHGTYEEPEEYAHSLLDTMFSFGGGGYDEF